MRLRGVFLVGVHASACQMRFFCKIPLDNQFASEYFACDWKSIVLLLIIKVDLIRTFRATMSIENILISSLYFLAIINPVSKISVLSVFATEKNNLREVALKSSFVAAAILLIVMFFGDFLMRQVFRIDLHSLQIAGGIVLFWVGFNALKKGVFFEVNIQSRFQDIAIVPLACPMIAGPATIAATLTFASQHNKSLLLISLSIALAFNMMLMFSATAIGKGLKRFNILGALIRITGLFVMTIGVQMILNGAGDWYRSEIYHNQEPMPRALVISEK